MKGKTAYNLVKFLNFFGFKYRVVVVCRNDGSLKTHTIAKIKSDNIIVSDRLLPLLKHKSDKKCKHH